MKVPIYCHPIKLRTLGFWLAPMTLTKVGITESFIHDISKALWPSLIFDLVFLVDLQ